MNPFKLKPSVAEIIWGGRRLIDEYGIETDKKNAAEAWMLSCHKNGQSTISTGEFQGESLADLFAKHPEIAGEKAKKYDRFPLLIKFIDAKKDLSIQVHPDDEYAQKNEGEFGKTEAWYILDCDEGAELILGFDKTITPDQFRKAVESDEILDYVKKIKVRKGDMFFIEAGTLHAIGKGILLAEVQQNSDSTYRVYDYGRLGLDGKPRELHVDKAVDVTKIQAPSLLDKDRFVKEEKDGYVKKQLTKCDLFTLFHLDITSHYEANADINSFVSLLCLDGEGELISGDYTLTVKKGESIFIPAGCGNFTVRGTIEILETRL